MSKRSAASAHLDGLNTAPTTPTTVKEHRPEDEVKTPDPIQHWLASVTDTMALVKNLQFQKIKFPPLPERQAVLDYLNALRLTDEQVLKYEELCCQASETLRSCVDKTHRDLNFYNCYYRGKTTLGCKKDTQFGEAYKNTANIWPWLVERATDMLWDERDYVLAFIFHTLFKVCGVSAVAHMALWERVLVSHHYSPKTYNCFVPQGAVSLVFFSAVFNYEIWYHDPSPCSQYCTYVASVVVHNTFEENEMDINFANYAPTAEVVKTLRTRLWPVRANEILIGGLVISIQKKLAATM